MFSIKTKYFPFSINRKHGIFKEHLLIVLYVVFTCFLRVVSLQGKRYMVTFIISHYKHRVSLQHSVTLSTDTIEGINW